MNSFFKGITLLFTGGMYVIYGMKAAAAVALRAFLWAARKIRSHHDAQNGKLTVNITSDWNGRKDRAVIEEGFDYIEQEYGRRPKMKLHEGTRIHKTTRSRNRRKRGGQ